MSNILLKNELFLKLLELQEFEFDSKKIDVNLYVDNVLMLICEIGCKQILPADEVVNFTEDEQELFASLVISNIGPIKDNIKRTPFTCHNQSIDYLMSKRMAIKYLLDNFGQFTIEGSNLATILTDLDLEDSITTLDKLIAMKRQTAILNLKRHGNIHGIYNEMI